MVRGRGRARLLSRPVLPGGEPLKPRIAALFALAGRPRSVSLEVLNVLHQRLYQRPLWTGPDLTPLLKELATFLVSDRGIRPADKHFSWPSQVPLLCFHGSLSDTTTCCRTNWKRPSASSRRQLVRVHLRIQRKIRSETSWSRCKNQQRYLRFPVLPSQLAQSGPAFLVFLKAGNGRTVECDRKQSLGSCGQTEDSFAGCSFQAPLQDDNDSSDCLAQAQPSHLSTGWSPFQERLLLNAQPLNPSPSGLACAPVLGETSIDPHEERQFLSSFGRLRATAASPRNCDRLLGHILLLDPVPLNHHKILVSKTERERALNRLAACFMTGGTCGETE